MRKLGLIAGMGAVLALLALVAALPALAAPPANTFPGAAAYIDNGTHTIPANSSLWYRFDYAGDRSEIVLTLPNGTNSGLGFNVYTPSQIGDWWNESPIGRGTAQAQDCDTGLPATNGQCQSNDLTWVGNFNGAGPYYVQVINHTGSDLSASLLIQGSGVSLAPQAAASPQVPAAQPTTTPASGTPTPAPSTSMANTDPGHAAVIDNAGHTIPANSSLWYRFSYAGDRSLITATLANGNGSGMGFKVFTPAQIGDWWETNPIGQGTALTLDCSTGLPKPLGACQSDDLTWNGQFNAPGTYYIELTNYNSAPMQAVLTIAGDGVSLGQ